jgi:hypothetical protein
MNRDEIQTAILQVCKVSGNDSDFNVLGFYALCDRLVELGAAAEREAIKWNRIHSCHADCQNPACVIVREAVAAEREACAKICEEPWQGHPYDIAKQIRARGQK